MPKNRYEADFSPMSLMSLLLSFVSLIIICFLFFSHLAPETRHTLKGIDTAICVLFLLQISIDFCRCKHRGQYLKMRWLDIVASIPTIEILRFARIWQIIRLVSLFRHSHYFVSKVKENKKEATLATIFTLLIILVCTGSTFMLMFEQDAIGSNIHNASDALWWSLVTISTVGYGDHYPVTLGGKILATGMIICGVGIFGMISGLITSILTAPRKNDKAELDNLQTLIRQQKVLLKKIERLELKIDEQSKERETESEVNKQETK
ncbi:MAG: ion transporter [Vibrio sp.]